MELQDRVFFGDEDMNGENCVVRSKASAVIATCLENWRDQSSTALADVVVAQLNQGDEMHSQAAYGWWKPREAATLALGKLLFEPKSFKKQKSIRLESLLEDIVVKAMSQNGSEE